MRICIPTHLTDAELTDALARLAGSSRGTTARLVAHIAEFDARKLHLAGGFPSLFAYCREVLHLSEPESGNRIAAARAARRFPVVLDLLDAGSVNLTTVRLLAPHLTRENHRELLAATTQKSKRDVEELIASRFPRPDIASSIRRLPTPTMIATSLDGPPLPNSIGPGVPSGSVALQLGSRSTGPESAGVPPIAATPPPRPSVIATLAPTRYEIRFTASAETREKLQRAQEQLRHAIPTGDLAEIFDRALTALIADLARQKVAALRSSAKDRTPRATALG
jgi:hypothetical protein